MGDDRNIGYAACLRGLNVGAKNRVAMADLREIFQQAGALDVVTYIQSGNVVFRSPMEAETLRLQLESAFSERFGFSSPILLRTGEQLRRILESCPFTDEELREAEQGADVEHLHVAMLGDEPTEEAVRRVFSYASPTERIAVVGRDAYLLVHNGIHKSKVATNLHRLGAAVTLRNWNTVNRLCQMLAEQEK